ncbi:MAG: hypothetical protein HQL31_03460 [Planctomycetes bacterium]|nr:hypothetical protein [Planctomycetota bacterium]
MWPGSNRIYSDCILIGASTGGPKAIIGIFKEIQRPLPVPVVVVNHFPAGPYAAVLAEEIEKVSACQAMVVDSPEILEANRVYISPGGKHLQLNKLGTRLRVKTTDDPPLNACRPSVDYLFFSAAKIQLSSFIVMVLSGMGDDGLRGAGLLRANGAPILTQDRASSSIYGMPKVIVEHGLSDGEMDLTALAHAMSSHPKKLRRSKFIQEMKAPLPPLREDPAEDKFVDSQPTVSGNPKGEKCEIAEQEDAPEREVLTEHHRALFRDKIVNDCGNVTFDQKGYLLDIQVEGLMRKYHCSRVSELFQKIKIDPLVRQDYLHSMTIHESYFFRDQYPFRYLSQLFSEWEERGETRRKHTITSIGCANGQEAYSIAFTFGDYLANTNNSSLSWKDIQICGFDISRPCLEIAKRGIYERQQTLRGIRQHKLAEYFEEDQGFYRVKNQFRQSVHFQELNILEDLSPLKESEVIFVRYTLIYFPQEIQSKTIAKIVERLTKKGVLVLDSAMSLRIDHPELEAFKFENHTLYRKIG